MTPLTEATLAEAVAELTARDPVLAGVVARHGPPPIWARSPGFATLLHIILEQQVSLASARAAFERLQISLTDVTPAAFLTLDDDTLRAIGFSRQKTRYGRLLAEAVVDGRLDLTALASRPDAAVHDALTAITGIGRWTAGIYLLMALRRPDAWPTGDRALALAAQRLYGLPAVPAYPALDAMAEAWRPQRATAARLLWHHYLSA